ncbi:lipase [Stachybotrys elegans]|uniref:Lipase n=1 Tax=Stachybotrys elegans TaxID=80388 RepID=A0A8K0SD67_9HYPO|nr:lipase [Stachybotrys elegans]
MRLTLCFLPVLLGTAVSGSPVQPQDEQLHVRSTTGVTEGQLADMKYYVQYAAAAYCNSQPSLVNRLVSCSDNACPLLSSNSVKNYAFVGFDQSISRGFVAIDPVKQAIVVALMGTNSIAGFIADVLVPLESIDLCSGCKAHQGWYDGLGDIRGATVAAVRAAKQAWPSYKVVVTGHSLGGAVGTLLAATLRSSGIATDLYTYGSPMVGNSQLVQFINAQRNGVHYRVTHVNDPVPRFPPTLFGYRQTDTEFWLKTGGSETTSYTTSDVQVCTGAKSSCNGGQGGLDLTAHSHYFQRVSACKGGLTY